LANRAIEVYQSIFNIYFVPSGYTNLGIARYPNEVEIADAARKAYRGHIRLQPFTRQLSLVNS